MGQIEWPGVDISSLMTVTVKDNTDKPVSVLDASKDTTINFKWTVPPEHSETLGGSFRLRAYAESIGPGQELQIGDTLIVPVAPSTKDYEANIKVLGNTLKGEGDIFDGALVSGVYRIVGVLQHLNPGPNSVSGFDEVPIRMFTEP